LQYLNTLDYAVIGIYCVVLIAIALYLKTIASRSLEDYFLGGRQLPWWALGISGMTNFLDMTGTMVIVSFLFLLGPRGLYVEFRGGAVLVLAFMMLWTGKWHYRSQCMTGAEWNIYRFGNTAGAKLSRIIAVIGGTLIEKMKMEEQVEGFIKTAGGVDIESPTLTRKDRLRYAREQTAATFKKVFPYILIGVGIGALIHNWIPEDWVAAVLGSKNPFGVVLATLIGVPMYGDIFGTIPIAEALLLKGALLGSILAFMMAVTTLSLPSLIMLRKAVKPKLLALFIAICTIGIIIVGYVFNLLQAVIL